MNKIIRVWVSKKTRVDGKVYYTAHVQERKWVLGIIPVTKTRDLVQITWYSGKINEYKTFELYCRTCGFSVYKFRSKLEAEAELVNILDLEAEEYNKNRNRQVAKVEDFPIS